MLKRDLKIGDVVQLRPEHKFGGMVIVVTEPKSWGCQGYLMSQSDIKAVKFMGVAYVRATYEDFEYVGTLHWLFEDKEESCSTDT